MQEKQTVPTRPPSLLGLFKYYFAFTAADIDRSNDVRVAYIIGYLRAFLLERLKTWHAVRAFR